MPNRLAAAIADFRRTTRGRPLSSTSNANLLETLSDMCLAEGGAGVQGITVFVDDGRLWVSHRGDPILNWRQAGDVLVIENAVGELAVAHDIERALTLTASEIVEHLPTSPRLTRALV
jgi:hypothetical protein